jgi:hypothetical protein
LFVVGGELQLLSGNKLVGDPGYDSGRWRPNCASAP